MPQEADGRREIEDGSNLPSANSKLPVSPTIAKLNALPKRRYGNVTWPPGTPQPFNYTFLPAFSLTASPFGNVPDSGHTILMMLGALVPLAILRRKLARTRAGA
jgi:hypothetical protein